MLLYTILNAVIVLLSFLYLLVLKHLTKRTSLFLAFLLYLFFVLVIMFRPLDSPDTSAYMNIYGSSRRILGGVKEIDLFSKYGDNDGTYEYGFLAISAFFSLFASFRFFLGAIALFTSLIIPYCLSELFRRKEEKSVNYKKRLSFFVLYLCTFGLLYSGVAIRAGCGISIGLMSSLMIKKRRFLLAIVFLVLAFSVHRTSIVFLIIDLLFLLSVKEKRCLSQNRIRFLLIVELFAVLVLLVLGRAFLYGVINNVFGSIGLDSYLSYHTSESGLGLTKILICLIVFGLLFYISIIKAPIANTHIYLLLFIPLLIILFADFRAASRLYDQFLIFIVGVIIYSYYKVIKTNRFGGSILLGGFVLAISFVFMNTIFTFTS